MISLKNVFNILWNSHPENLNAQFLRSALFFFSLLAFIIFFFFVTISVVLKAATQLIIVFRLEIAPRRPMVKRNLIAPSLLIRYFHKCVIRK